MENLLTKKEAAKFLKISEVTLWRAYRSGKLVAFRIGNLVRFSHENLMAYAQAGTNAEAINKPPIK